MDKRNSPMKKLDAPEKVIYVCDGKKCGPYNKSVRKAFKAVAKEHGMKKHIEIMCMGCSDNCKNAPVVCLQPQNVWIGEVEEKQVPAIFKEYFL